MPVWCWCRFRENLYIEVVVPAIISVSLVRPVKKRPKITPHQGTRNTVRATVVVLTEPVLLVFLCLLLLARYVRRVAGRG